MSETSDILEQLLNQLRDEIVANIPTASGETARNIEVRVTNPGKDEFTRVKGELIGPKYIQALEDGRGPSKRKGGGTQTLQQAILKWLQIKGIQPQVNAVVKRRKTLKATVQQNPQIGLSWAIATKIHREGNKLFREGGKSGVLSNVINDQRIDNFIEVFNAKATRVLLAGVTKTILAK